MVIDVILESYSLFTETFSYAVPENLQESLQIGSLIRVPFRGKVEKAIVLAIKDTLPEPSYKLIESMVHDMPVLFPYQATIGKWIADYYVCPLFKSIDLFLPSFVWKEKQDDWVEREWQVFLLDETKGKGAKEKKVIDVLHPRGTKATQICKKIENVNISYLQVLARKGIISMTPGDIIPPYFKSYHVEDIEIMGMNGLKTMTNDQKRVVDTITANRGKIFLLHGVTGAGKTEIYIQLAYENFKQGKQTCVLVPEIALTPQLIAYFYKVFGNKISVIHSGISDGEKFTEWVRIRNNESTVVIGSRSALFSPFVDVGTIILDEEHEWTYKSDQNPRYHTRTVAIEMAKKLSCSVVLGSATPDVESYYKAKQGEYILLELQKKIMGS